MIDEARRHPSPDPSTVDPVVRRAAFRERALGQLGEMDPVALREDREITAGDVSVSVRLYAPVVEDGGALIVYAHGGSFCLGDLDTHEGLCRRIATDTGMRVLAVDYRLAPEHPFPQGLDDVVEVVTYVGTHLSEFAPEGYALVVMGDSAGANLVTVAAALLRERVDIAAQVLIYPTLGPENVTASAHEYGTGYLLEMSHMRHDYECYLSGQSDPTDWRVSPLLNEDLGGVAPAVIVVAEYDPLRDEGVAYAGLLEHFGVPVRIFEAEGMIHGFLRLGGVFEEVKRVVDDVASHLRTHVREWVG